MFVEVSRVYKLIGKATLLEGVHCAFFCDECGTDFEEERSKSQPWTVFCIECGSNNVSVEEADFRIIMQAMADDYVDLFSTEQVRDLRRVLNLRRRAWRWKRIARLLRKSCSTDRSLVKMRSSLPVGSLLVASQCRRPLLLCSETTFQLRDLSLIPGF
jgi:hypothetical protein